MDATKQEDSLCMRRSELLKHNDECVEEEAVLGPDDQIRELTAQLEEYETVMERLLTVAGIPSAVLTTGSRKDEESHATHSANDRPTIDQVEILRVALKAKTELLQFTEDKYEEFMVASYEVEKALIHENETLKRLVNELQHENARLQRAHQNN
ncbi:hypothetical protein V7S43_010295 [Phytophthora oleae]|uniref:Uncharacterized protein n=1 Tax=Phytophthora oleae TaxID=2107226 RepID=A0ABD3FCU9_9STRA